jgi:arsenate reductase
VTAELQGKQRAKPEEETMSDGHYNVLFLCTGNSARSIMGESLVNGLGKGRFRGFSGGSHPRGIVDPHVLQMLRALDLPTDGLRSKSWDTFAGPDAPVMDFVFTLCDSAVGEACPDWPGHPITAHWGLPDPVKATGEPWEIDRAYSETFKMLRRRIELLFALPFASLDRMALEQRVRDIGAQADADRAAKATV